MARVWITYWREIPVLVTAREGAEEATVPLSPRFQELVDAVAMREGLAGAEAYLAAWRQGPAEEHPGPAVGAAALEERFDEVRARALSSAAG